MAGGVFFKAISYGCNIKTTNAIDASSRIKGIIKYQKQ